MSDQNEVNVFFSQRVHEWMVENELNLKDAAERIGIDVSTMRKLLVPESQVSCRTRNALCWNAKINFRRWSRPRERGEGGMYFVDETSNQPVAEVTVARPERPVRWARQGWWRTLWRTMFPV